VHIIRNIIRVFFPLAVVITLFSGMVYIAVQQVLRQSANDPQIQMAEDAASALASGKPVESVMPTPVVDIAASLAPYLVVYDDAGKPIAASGLLHNQMPALPPGVFDYVRQKGEDRITWQPEPGVRNAAIVTRAGGSRPGFVMAGRSLREVEGRETNTELLVGLGWLGTLLAAFIAVSISEMLVGGSALLKLASVPRAHSTMRQPDSASQ
jgi:hypothetical protein